MGNPREEEIEFELLTFFEEVHPGFGGGGYFTR